MGAEESEGTADAVDVGGGTGSTTGTSTGNEEDTVTLGTALMRYVTHQFMEDPRCPSYSLFVRLGTMLQARVDLLPGRVWRRRDPQNVASTYL